MTAHRIDSEGRFGWEPEATLRKTLAPRVSPSVKRRVGAFIYEATSVAEGIEDRVEKARVEGTDEAV